MELYVETHIQKQNIEKGVQQFINDWSEAFVTSKLWKLLDTFWTNFFLLITLTRKHTTRGCVPNTKKTFQLIQNMIQSWDQVYVNVYLFWKLNSNLKRGCIPLLIWYQIWSLTIFNKFSKTQIHCRVKKWNEWRQHMQCPSRV